MENSQNEALKFAMKLIGLRRRSVFEIETRLKEKGYDKKIQQSVMKELEHYGYIDDKSFAESYISDRIKFNPRGRALIKLELKKRGIDNAIIENALEEILDEKQEEEMARKIAAKKVRMMTGKDPKKVCVKIIFHLKSKGFPSNIIHKAIDKEVNFNKNINADYE